MATKLLRLVHDKKKKEASEGGDKVAAESLMQLRPRRTEYINLVLQEKNKLL